jgi:hypothetical protein
MNEAKSEIKLIKTDLRSTGPQKLVALSYPSIELQKRKTDRKLCVQTEIVSRERRCASGPLASPLKGFPEHVLRLLKWKGLRRAKLKTGTLICRVSVPFDRSIDRIASA